MAKKSSGDPGDTGLEPAQLSRRERKKARIRKQLSETAMELFRRQGFAATTIEQITEQVDVAPATFFNYFPSKDAVLADYHRELAERLLEYANRETSESIKERFAALSAWHEERVRQEGRLYKVLIQEFLARPKILMGNIETGRKVFEVLVGWIEEGKGRGELRPDVDAVLAVTTIIGIWNAVSLEWAAAPEPSRKCLNFEDRVGLLFDGLTA